jgi:hydroxypyruvate reductase
VSTTTDPRALLDQVYRTAVTATRPDVAVERALGRVVLPRGRLEAGAGHAMVHVLAIGKAAVPMARGALAACTAQEAPVAGGLCIVHEAPAEAHGLAPLAVVVGDHPVPGARSLAAADALGAYLRDRVRDGDHAIVLVSGGTSSLVAAPLPGLVMADITALGEALLHCGHPIDAVNRVRRRVHRWGGGRLAAALGERCTGITVLLVSDVIGDTLPSIGSGPCTADPVPRDEVLALLDTIPGVPARVRAWVAADRDDARMPAAGDPRTAYVRQQIVTSSATLAAAAHDQAWTRALHAETSVARLAGDAHDAGRAFVAAMLAARLRREGRGVRAIPSLRIAIGEPVVHVVDPARALGGRMQAFALAAAHALHDAGDTAEGLHLLAAGSDGRDGPTDAAGAIVDRHTWARIRAAGHDPDRALAEHRSYLALDAVDATIRAWDTGTNVNDLVLGLDLPPA